MMKNRIESLQILRALAFSGIFLSHSEFHCFHGGGPWGVSVFLILSGFLMYCAYSDTERISEHGLLYSIKFGIGKIKKLYPLHIVTMLCMLVMQRPYLDSCFLNILFLNVIPRPVFAGVLNVALLKSWASDMDIYYSYNGVSWYLSVTLFLYIMFPLILWIMQKYKSTQTAKKVLLGTFALQILLAFLSKYILPHFFRPENIIYWFTYIFPLSRLEDFVIGCNLGFLFQHREKENAADTGKRTMLEAGVFAVILLQWILYASFITNPSRDNPIVHDENWWAFSVLWTVSSCVLIWVFAEQKGRITSFLNRKPLLLIGNLSAYAFLIHQMVYYYLEMKENTLFQHSYPYANIFLCFFITMTLSFLWDFLMKRISGNRSIPPQKA